VWLTDIHLNFLGKRQTRKLARQILSQDPTHIILSGDQSDASKFRFEMGYLMEHLNDVPVYFVAGNHDYYHGSIKGFRKYLKEYHNHDAQSKWLPNLGIITASPNVAIIGHDGWADGGYADWFKSNIILNDYVKIKELAENYRFAPQLTFQTIQDLARESAEYFQKYIKEAFKKHDKVFLVTHPVPFRECNLNPDRQIADDNWMPHFSSKIIGDTILDVMQEISVEKELTILCGHTHTESSYKPLPNVTCLVGGAEYYRPRINGVFEF